MPPRLYQCSACDHTIAESATFCPGCGTSGPLARDPNSSRVAKPSETTRALLAAEQTASIAWTRAGSKWSKAMVNVIVSVVALSSAVKLLPAAEYRSVFLREVGELQQSQSRVAELLMNPHPQDDSWRHAVEAEYALWQADYDRAQKRVPPSRLTEVNAKYVHCLASLVDAGKQCAHGIDDDNPHEIDAGPEALKAAKAELQAAVALIPAR